MFVLKGMFVVANGGRSLGDKDGVHVAALEELCHLLLGKVLRA